MDQNLTVSYEERKDQWREKREQEKASLINVGDSFKKIIIVKDVVKPWHDDDGILTISLYDFLLDEKSLEL